MSVPSSCCAGLLLLLFLEAQQTPWNYLPGTLFGAPEAPDAERKLVADAPEREAPPDAPHAALSDAFPVTLHTRAPPAAAVPDTARSAPEPVKTPPVAPPPELPRAAPSRPPGLYLDGLLWRDGAPRAAWINGGLWQGALPPHAMDGIHDTPRLPRLRLPGWRQTLRVGQGWPDAPSGGTELIDPAALDLHINTGEAP